MVRRILLVIASAAVATTAQVGAQPPELIHACVSSPRGNVRLVAAGEACLQSERPVQWPATAPAGGGGSLRVLDGSGAFVAWLMSAGPIFPNALMQVGDDWVALSITVDSLAGTLSEVQFFYATPCPAGGALHGFPGHLMVALPNLTRQAGRLKSEPGVVYYPGDIDAPFVPVSVEGMIFGSTTRVCQPMFSIQATTKFAHPVSLDVSSLRAPFRISQ